ncbi:14476_t:CDS:2, partial [Cetraspora pellucida]
MANMLYNNLPGFASTKSWMLQSAMISKYCIQNTIKCGSESNYPVVARSGGHSYEGYGIGDKDCYLV